MNDDIRNKGLALIAARFWDYSTDTAGALLGRTREIFKKATGKGNQFLLSLISSLSSSLPCSLRGFSFWV